MMRPPPRVVRQFQGRSPDEVRQLHGSTIHRLGILWNGPYLFDAESAARSIESQQDVLYFFDTTQFIAATPQPIWQALLNKKRLVITPPVFQELEWWLAAPKENLEVHQAIKASLAGDESAPIAWVTLESPYQIVVCEYYTNLLGMRKRMFIAARLKLAEKLGRLPTNQEISNYCQKIGTSRAQLLGRQGANSKVLAHKYNDECLVVLAVMFAIVSGKEVTIVSGDEAVLDQFYKAIWLIDTHYRSMLLAGRYADDPLAFPVHRVDNPHKEAFADETILLLKKPSSDLRDVLPVAYTPVRMNCVLLQNGTVTEMTFNAEKEMRRLFNIKGRTNGLSTDRLEGKNCHVFLGDIAVKKTGNWAAIATDLGATLPNSEMSLSVVDVNLALLSDEHFTRVEIAR